MKKIFLIAAAATGLAMAPSAVAQTDYRNSAEARADFRTRIAQLEARLVAGIRDRAIDRREERTLRQQIQTLRQLEYRYAYNGLTRAEQRDLRQRIRATRQQIRLADNNRYDRDTRYGYWNDRYWNEQYGSNAYGQNYYGQNYYGMGGPYEEESRVCFERGGIAGVLGSIFNSDANCLSVGERVTTGLYALPPQLQTQFRADPYRYYRYADGKVIEVDSRTHVVTRIYDVD